MANSQFAAKYIKPGEGGWSHSQKDEARHDPAPWTWQGRKDWHTSYGITHTTFKAYAQKLGYYYNAETFFNMPEAVWFKIFKEVYWNAIQGDKIKSDVIATYATTWLWGSGVSGGMGRLKKFLLEKYGKQATVYNIAQVLNELTATGDRKLFEAMLESRAAQFKAMNQPANYEGWIARLDKYKTNLLPFTK